MTIAFFITRLVCSLVGILVASLWRRRWAELVFYRRLRKAGVPQAVAEELAERYSAGIAFRNLFRVSRPARNPRWNAGKRMHISCLR